MYARFRRRTSSLQGPPPPEGYNHEWLAGFVERLSAFDRDMNVVVQDSRILAGVAADALAMAGGGPRNLEKKNPKTPGMDRQTGIPGPLSPASLSQHACGGS